MLKPIFHTMLALSFTCSAWAGDRVGYSVGDESFLGYYEASTNAKATIVILPTWNGISDYEMDRANMLVAQGFNAFAADVHGKGAIPRSMEAKQAAYKDFFSRKDRLHALLKAIVQKASSLGGDKLVVMGYSMGGGALMEIARSGLGEKLGVDGYAVFSGRVSDPQSRIFPDSTGPIFVARGEKDTRLSLESLGNFQEELEISNIEHEIHIYPGVGHMFSAPGFPNYNENANEQSWNAYLQYLRKLFG